MPADFASTRELTMKMMAVLAMSGVVLSACMASGTPNYDARFGEAVRQARALQTLNPEAGRQGGLVTGIDAQAGKSALDRYQESFRTPSRSFEVLGIGSGSPGGGADR